MTSRFAVIVEKSRTGFSAYVPDLPGCGATGQTMEEVEKLIREGVKIHLDGMREDGDPIPEPTIFAEMIAINIPPAA